MLVSRTHSKAIVYFPRRTPTVRRLPELIQRMSQLLHEGYTFANCLTMLMPYYVKDFEYWHTVIHDCFQQGQSATTILQKFGVKPQYLVAIQLAENSGRLAETLQTISQQMIFHEKIKNQFMKILLYPALLFSFIISLFIAFRLYYLPTVEQLLFSRTVETKSGTMQWTKWLLHVPDYFIIFALVCVMFIVITFFYVKRKRVDLQVYFLIKTPIIRYFWRLIITRQFARSLGDLLTSGMSLQQSLEYLKEQEYQQHLSFIAHKVHERLIYGDSLPQVVILLNYFHPRFEQFIHHGEVSGLLARELIIYSELLDGKLQNMIHMTMKFIQPLLFLVIASCIIAAYLSILLPMYKMLDVI